MKQMRKERPKEKKLVVFKHKINKLRPEARPVVGMRSSLKLTFHFLLL